MSECSLFSRLPVGENKCLILFVSMPYMHLPLINNAQEPRKAAHIFWHHTLNQKQSLQGEEKNPGSPMALQTAGHSPAGSSTWTRVSLGAGTRCVKTLLPSISPAALQPFPPSHKTRAAFLMIQHKTRFLPLIPQNTEVSATRATQK